MDKSINKFFEHYGSRGSEPSMFFAPGRVNLIGEHTDYNGGLVMPFAISKGTYLYLRKNNTQIWRFYSENMDAEYDIPCQYPCKNIPNDWLKYPLGIIQLLNLRMNIQIEGYDFYFSSNLPQGSGLSSSASIEAVTAFALVSLLNIKPDLKQLSLLCREAEHIYASVQCGIMDQFAVINGEENAAMMLNCDTLEFQNINISLDNYSWVVSNTNKPRELIHSAYNERLRECKDALIEINRHCDEDHHFNNLCEINISLFNELQYIVGETTPMKRARHVISEHARVKEMANALQNKDLKTIGRLLYQSHESLKLDYEVTGIELDTLVEEASKIEGVIGSRMTGAGFGGCTITLMKDEVFENYCEIMKLNYFDKTKLQATFYKVKASQGVHKLQFLNATV